MFGTGKTKGTGLGCFAPAIQHFNTNKKLILRKRKIIGADIKFRNLIIQRQFINGHCNGIFQYFFAGFAINNSAYVQAQEAGVT